MVSGALPLRDFKGVSMEVERDQGRYEAFQVRFKGISGSILRVQEPFNGIMEVSWAFEEVARAFLKGSQLFKGDHGYFEEILRISGVF